MIRRLSNRSATTPPNAPNSRIGRNVSAVSIPRAVPLWVSCSTSHGPATPCIQVPLVEMSCPTMNSRKLRTLSEWKVRRMYPTVSGTTAPPTASSRSTPPDSAAAEMTGRPGATAAAPGRGFVPCLPLAPGGREDDRVVEELLVGGPPDVLGHVADEDAVVAGRRLAGDDCAHSIRGPSHQLAALELVDAPRPVSGRLRVVVAGTDVRIGDVAEQRQPRVSEPIGGRDHGGSPGPSCRGLQAEQRREGRIVDPARGVGEGQVRADDVVALLQIGLKGGDLIGVELLDLSRRFAEDHTVHPA